MNFAMRSSEENFLNFINTEGFLCKKYLYIYGCRYIQ